MGDMLCWEEGGGLGDVVGTGAGIGMGLVGFGGWG